MSEPQRGKKRKPQHLPRDTKPGLTARRTAQRLLAAIVDAHTPMDALTDDNHGHPDYLALETRDRALVRAILMASLRYRADLEAIIDRFVERPLPDGATSLRHILHVALAQILLLDIPDHSAVDLAVDSATADPRTRRFASLVNALTRRCVRSKEKLKTQLREQPIDGPDWFTLMLFDAYGPERARAILAAHRREAPIDLVLRSNAMDAQSYANQIGGIKLHDRAVRMTAGQPVVDLPGFNEGHFWVQDVAAGIPAILMGDVNGKRVLDTCAAPGGKTAQLLDAGGDVVALDISKNRLKRLSANMERLGLASRCTTVAQSLFDYEPKVLFDAVLVDAPCSSTGTIRRHPDVAWVKTDDDIIKLADLQYRLLEKAAQLVGPGGILVFSNCSLDPREGEQIAQRFAQNFAETFAPAAIEPSQLPWLADAIDANGFIRTTPDMLEGLTATLSGLDGFFAARFKRKL